MTQTGKVIYPVKAYGSEAEALQDMHKLNEEQDDQEREAREKRERFTRQTYGVMNY